jgi:aspartyl-tRNA(Asn)/glutamyl-tRNA(Gln) amidotransferase subunit C
MSLNSEDVVKIARLASLKIDEEQIPEFAQELSTILDLVEQMNSVDIDEVTPMAHPLDTTQRLRPDLISETDQREVFQAQAPAVRDHLYLVPRVIE